MTFATFYQKPGKVGGAGQKKDGGRKGEDGGKEFEKERWQRLTLGESILHSSPPS
jgi:hypothetical protein